MGILTKKTKNFENFDENRVKSRETFSYKIKKFLKWLDLRDSMGERLVTEDTIMPDIYSSWSKNLVIWFIEIMLTGILVYLAILPFWSVPLSVAPFTAFSLGLLWYILLKLIKDVKTAIGGK